MIKKFLDILDELSRRRKWVIMTLLDLILIQVALYAAYVLHNGEIFPSEQILRNWPLFVIMTVPGFIYSWILKIPTIKLQFFDLNAVQRIALCSLLLILTAMILGKPFKLTMGFSIPIIFGFFYFTAVLFSRMNALRVLKRLNQLGNVRTPVIIYGAGEAGIQLVSSLQQTKEVKPVAFIDDNKLNQKVIIFGLPVYGPEDLEKIVKQKKVEKILIAIPSLSETDRKVIANRLAYLSCKIQIMPSNVDMIYGESFLETLIPVKAEELLGREKFISGLTKISLPYESKTVLISGAGGSIGSELCRQILDHSPTKIVLFERSELALYSIERELRPLAEKLGITLIPILGSVCDEKFIEHVFQSHNVQVVFHAAAYKHVPLIESNEVSGTHNNVIGTHIIAQQALKSKVETFILISSDKAVRPKNIMGGTKRLAELIVADFDKRSKVSKFSMVRFGNVLGSSGSVIPLFKDQIAKGGPVTLTHEEVTRYFMALSEAAYLVIAAGSYAEGGEVFMLNMGAPIKIKDLARSLIEKSGYTVCNKDNPHGDIEILITGLRPGEKLNEALLIDAETLKTPHPKIMRAKEKSLSPKTLQGYMKDIKKAISDNDKKRVRQIIAAAVEKQI